MVKDTQKRFILMLFKIKFSTILKKELPVCNSNTLKKHALGRTHTFGPLGAKVMRLDNKFQF